MIQENQIISMLDEAEYIYLRHISEPTENSLRLVVQEATVSSCESAENSASTEPFSELRKDASPIETTAGCKTFELIWDLYVAYLVTEEVAGSAGDHQSEVYTGNTFRVYSRSHFLDYLACNTSGHTGPLTHYKVVCLNHLIDVASIRPPEIKLLDTESEEVLETKARIN